MLLTFGDVLSYLRMKFNVFTSMEDESVLGEDIIFQNPSLLYCAPQRRTIPLIHWPTEKSKFDEIINNNRYCQIFSNIFWPFVPWECRVVEDNSTVTFIHVLPLTRVNSNRNTCVYLNNLNLNLSISQEGLVNIRSSLLLCKYIRKFILKSRERLLYLLNEMLSAEFYVSISHICKPHEMKE